MKHEKNIRRTCVGNETNIRKKILAVKHDFEAFLVVQALMEKKFGTNPSPPKVGLCGSIGLRT